MTGPGPVSTGGRAVSGWAGLVTVRANAPGSHGPRTGGEDSCTGVFPGPNSASHRNRRADVVMLTMSERDGRARPGVGGPDRGSTDDTGAGLAVRRSGGPDRSALGRRAGHPAVRATRTGPARGTGPLGVQGRQR